MNKIKVMIVDDSFFVRALLRKMLENDDPKNRFEVVASAIDGEDALRKLRTQEIDVITLDIEMPIKNGIDTLKEIMKINPKPTIMLSSLTKSKESAKTIEALSLGAVDFVGKPDENFSLNQLKDEIYEKLEAASKIKPTKMKLFQTPPPPPLKETFSFPFKREEKQVHSLILIGCSTGGPKALGHLITQLPADLPAAIVVVQHMPEGDHTKNLAKLLNPKSNFEIKEAEDGEELVDGKMYIAPAGFHTEIYKQLNKYRIVLNRRDPVSGHRPSVDVLFSSVAKLNLSIPVFATVLTGMGSDGANGSGELHQKGIPVIAESERTAIIYGMPKQVAVRGYATYQEDLHNVIPKLCQLVKKSMHGY